MLSDRIVVQITQKPGESFIDRMIALVEGANRQKTPNEIALNILLAALTIIFLLAVATLQPLAIFSKAVQAFAPDSLALNAHGVTGIVLVSLLVCLIPTTIGALLSAIGIAGMDRLVQRNVLAMSGRAVEAAGDVNTLLLDKTGTITLGNRQASEFIPVGDVTPRSWPTPRSCPAWPTRRPRAARSWSSPRPTYGLRERQPGELGHATWVPFTAQTRMSGVDLAADGSQPGARAPQGRGGRGGRVGPRATAAPCRPRSGRSSTASPPPAARRWWSASASAARPGCSASSTSRTSSRPACASGSTRCAGWASAR